MTDRKTPMERLLQETEQELEWCRKRLDRLAKGKYRSGLTATAEQFWLGHCMAYENIVKSIRLKLDSEKVKLPTPDTPGSAGDSKV